jgi:hypothetical protein
VLLPDAACNKSVVCCRKLDATHYCKASRMKWEANGCCMRQYVFGTHKLVAFSTLSHHFLQPLGIHIVTSLQQYNYYISTYEPLNVIILNIKHNFFLPNPVSFHCSCVLVSFVCYFCNHAYIYLVTL